MKHLDRATRLLAFGSNKSPAPPRRRPWAVVIALPLALMALLWAATYDLPIASAASTTTYAGCGALGSNYFTTIQEAVNNTAPDGTVNICPGNYNESVDLNLMNGGGGTGDITVRKEPSVAGTVDWTSGSGPALLTSGFFTGSIAVQDLYIHDANGSGILFGTGVSGSVNISNVQSYRNHVGGYGMFIVNASQGITIVNSAANENPQFGFYLISALGAPPLYLKNVQANENGIYGIFIPQTEALDLLDSEANNNASTLIIGPALAGVYVVATTTVTECGPYDPDGPSINIENTEASHNAGFGFRVVSEFAPIHFTGTTANDNAFDGVAANSGDPFCQLGSVTVDDSTADQNGWYYQVLMEQGADLIAENGFSGPYAGFSLSADQLAVDGASAAENQNSGFCIDPFDGTATVTNSRAENNVEDGILHIPYFCSLFVNSSGGLTQAADFTAQVSLPSS